MLDILGRSRIRKKIILLFVYNQRKEFYLSEIARQVKTSAGTTQRELNKLLAQDFISFKKKGVNFAFLFGSFVEGSFKSDSDIDLFIIGAADEDAVYKTVQKVEDSVGREINYHLADEPEFIEKSKSHSFYRDILVRPLMLVGEENALRELIR